MGLLNFLFGKKDNALATVVPSQVTETEREGKEPPEIKNRTREISWNAWNKPKDGTIFMESMKITGRAMLSRAVSVIRGNTLIVNLPGSVKAVEENLGFVIPQLEHGIRILNGTAKECGRR